VEPSPWPLTSSIALLTTTVSAVMYFNNYANGGLFLTLGLIATISSMFLWFRDIIIESTYQGAHTSKVQQGLTLGFILFVISEVFFFISIGWAFFHSALSPTVELGCVWPPAGIEPLNPWELPLLNTIILLSSGVSLKCNELQDLFLFAILPFSSPRVPSTQRIGPHNIEILSILVGSMLGDGSMERDGNGSRFCFYQEKSHGEYLLWLHCSLSNLGYCKTNIPQIMTRKGFNGGIRYIYRFRTFTYSSFNVFYEEFHKKDKKIVPLFIENYFTPLALAVWIMDDGCKIKDRGLKFSTNSFSLKEVKFLAELLENKFELKTSIHKTGAINQYNIYIHKSSMPKLIEIVEPYIHPTMLYKIKI
jgi:hypothetical protein